MASADHLFCLCRKDWTYIGSFTQNHTLLLSSYSTWTNKMQQTPNSHCQLYKQIFKLQPQNIHQRSTSARHWLIHISPVKKMHLSTVSQWRTSASTTQLKNKTTALRIINPQLPRWRYQPTTPWQYFYPEGTPCRQGHSSCLKGPRQQEGAKVITRLKRWGWILEERIAERWASHPPSLQEQRKVQSSPDDLAYLSSLIRVKYLNKGTAKRHHKKSRTH